MRHLCVRLAAAVVLICVLGAGAATAAPQSKSYITDDIVAELHAVLANPVVAMVVNAQNDRHEALDQARIDELDQTWRAEREQDDKPLITATLTSPLSTYLTRVQADALGLYTEIFITDRHGLNAGQSAITSDYWQGDEAKFTETFPKGGDAVFIDEAEWHEGSRTWRAQANLTVTDPETGVAIGAATFEINLTELARRTNRTIARVTVD
ncbi:MAG: hypothetical protein AAFX39_01255 [Pseudomonadota bacterium]